MNRSTEPLGCGPFPSSESIFWHCQCQAHGWIVGRQNLPRRLSSARLIAGLIRDVCANGVEIALAADKVHANPVALLSDVVAQQNRSTIVDADEDLENTVIINDAGGELRRKKPDLSAR